MFSAALGNSFRRSGLESSLDRYLTILRAAAGRRSELAASGRTTAYRLFSGEAEGLPGVYVDRYGDAAVIVAYEGRASPSIDLDAFARAVAEVAGVGSVYLKPFARDRSKLGGEIPAEVLDPRPLVGEAVAESVVISELDWKLEVRLYDGWSTGLFLDQRENRGWVTRWVRERARGAVRPAPLSVLNTFAYTCAFSVASALGGAATTSVDVSARYLDWGRRNFGLNNIDTSETSGHRFARMDTFEFFSYARRKNLEYDLIILDPPSFGAGNKRKGIRTWSAAEDYARLVGEAAALLARGGVVLCSTNTAELCRPGRLEKEILRGLNRKPRWIELPGAGRDFAGERDRFASVAFA